MLFPPKQVYAKFCPLIVKMHVESAKSDQALKNLNATCDVKLILRPIFCHYQSVCTHSSKLHRVEMCSCAILLKV